MKDIPINFIPKLRLVLQLIKTLKGELFVSFNMDFKLKFYRKSSKTITIYY
jgi:hypothetical protein